MQIINISGRAGADAQIRDTKNGDSILNVNVAVDQRNGAEKTTNWYRCSIWGKRAQTLAPYIMKGTRVFICGELSISEYEGKQQLNVRVNDIEFFNDRSDEKAERKPTAHDRAKANGYQPDLNDDVPF
jgi:single-strand DNA-binding protein